LALAVLALVVFGAIEYIPFPDQTMVRKIGPSYETQKPNMNTYSYSSKRMSFREAENF